MQRWPFYTMVSSMHCIYPVTQKAYLFIIIILQTQKLSVYNTKKEQVIFNN